MTAPAFGGREPVDRCLARPSGAARQPTETAVMNMNDSHIGPRPVRDPSTSDDESVARLLRLAGHRPGVPADDAEIVKRAARAEWRRTVKVERRRALLYRGGGLLAAAALVLLVLNGDLLTPRPPAGERLAEVELATGPVRSSLGDGSPAVVAAGEALFAGAIVETAPFGDAGGSPGRAAFRLADGTSIRLDAGSRVRVLSGHELALDRGAVYADTGAHAAAGRVLAVHTPLGVVRDVGTQFEVRLDAAGSALAVRVREGEVILERDGGEAVSVTAGSELAVAPDGSVTEREMACHGPRWDWLLETLPPFERASATVEEILEWAARESCWRLVYADPALERQAAVTLEGSALAGVRPEEAVAVAVPAAGLSYRLSGGVLTIEP